MDRTIDGGHGQHDMSNVVLAVGWPHGQDGIAQVFTLPEGGLVRSLVTWGWQTVHLRMAL